MKIDARQETATFSTRGQIVIPYRVRKELGIEEGTRAVVQTRGAAIILHPMTRELVRSFRGCLKARSGEKRATRQLAEDRAEDLGKEEARLEERGA